MLEETYVGALRWWSVAAKCPRWYSNLHGSQLAKGGENAESSNPDEEEAIDKPSWTAAVLLPSAYP